jgi:hypothetical protein
MSTMKFYIDYRDCKNSYKETRKYFESYKKAMAFMTETFDTVNSDFINYAN